MVPGLLGKSYFTNATDAATAAASLLSAFNTSSTQWLSTDADKKVHIELSQSDNKLILQYVNFIGVTGSFSVIPTSASTTLNIPADKNVTAVELTSPDNVTPDLAPLTYTNTVDDVTFTVPVTEYAVVVVSLEDTGSAVNTPPVAVDDSYSTSASTPLVVAAPGILANDSDVDGDTLTVTSHTQPVASGTTTPAGTVAVNPDGDFTYTPVSGFFGAATFDYTISDGNNGVAAAAVLIAVSAPDTDSDGILDDQDNCIDVQNADQRDTDNDGYGNICDADFDGNNVVDSTDLSDLKAALRSTSTDKDLNGNGVVDSTDYSIARSYLRKPPGPSCADLAGGCTP
jgi:hypothetical protein